MRSYPTAKDQPNRKMRKSQRKKIFAENQDSVKVAREARRAAKKGSN